MKGLPYSGVTGINVECGVRKASFSTQCLQNEFTQEESMNRQGLNRDGTCPRSRSSPLQAAVNYRGENQWRSLEKPLGVDQLGSFLRHQSTWDTHIKKPL